MRGSLASAAADRASLIAATLENLAEELRQNPEAGRESEILSTIERVFGAVHGWKADRVRRMHVINIIRHAAREKRSAAADAQASRQTNLEI